jgi:uncharacterized membrane protein
MAPPAAVENQWIRRGQPESLPPDPLPNGNSRRAGTRAALLRSPILQTAEVSSSSKSLQRYIRQITLNGFAHQAYYPTMKEHPAKTTARKLLGATLVFAGISHLTFARKAFRAQVPDWVPLEKDKTVVLSGIAEVALGTAIALSGPAHQKAVGRIAAAFFVAVFPGNISQYVNRRSAFGLDTDQKRFARLFMQPGFVYWALKSS